MDALLEVMVVCFVHKSAKPVTAVQDCVFDISKCGYHWVILIKRHWVSGFVSRSPLENLPRPQDNFQNGYF